MSAAATWVMFRSVTVSGARERGRSNIKFYHVEWYVGFYPTNWNRSDCQCNIRGKSLPLLGHLSDISAIWNFWPQLQIFGGSAPPLPLTRPSLARKLYTIYSFVCFTANCSFHHKDIRSTHFSRTRQSLVWRPGRWTVSSFKSRLRHLFLIFLLRVLEYNSSSKLLEYTRYFLFPVANFHFRFQFFYSRLMNCWTLWKVGASRFHLQLASLEVELNIYMPAQGLDSSGPRYADPPPVLRDWPLVLKYFRHLLEYSLRYSDVYSSRKLLVSGSPT